MSKKPTHIEELFQEAFNGFESDVNPALWDKISSNIQPPALAPSDGGISSSGMAASGMSAGKIAAIIGIGGSLVGAGIWLSTADESNLTSDEDTPTSAMVSEEYTNSAAESASSISFEEADQSFNGKSQLEVEEQKLDETINSMDESTPSRPEANSNTRMQGDSKELVKKAPAVPINKQEGKAVNAALAEEKTEVAKESSEPTQKDEESVIKPLASIHASVKSGGIPLSVQFSNNDRNAAELIWDFGDGSKLSYEDAPYHTFNQAGDYSVILKVRAENNWESRDTMIITVRKNLTVMIPNIFTPNNDFINDVFKVEIDESDAVSSFECVVMDRSANVVYKTNNLFSHWNGQDLANRDCQPGPYYYVVKISRESLPDEVFKGVVQLKR